MFFTAVVYSMSVSMSASVYVSMSQSGGSGQGGILLKLYIEIQRDTTQISLYLHKKNILMKIKKYMHTYMGVVANGV